MKLASATAIRLKIQAPKNEAIKRLLKGENLIVCTRFHRADSSTYLSYSEFSASQVMRYGIDSVTENAYSLASDNGDSVGETDRKGGLSSYTPFWTRD